MRITIGRGCGDYVFPPRVVSASADVSHLAYSVGVLHEDDVVDAVVQFVIQHGWTIESKAYAHERGDDIVAVKDRRRLLVEAKGAGSSKAGTKRYGQPFTPSQVGSHLGVAVVRALRWTSSADVCAALAFPDNAHHRAQVGAITPALARIGVGLFWISEANREVELQAPWDL